MGDVAIQIEGLSKQYRLKDLAANQSLGRTLFATAKQVLRRPMKALNGSQDDEQVFWALKDVSFEVKKGEVLGILGRNGAGKSTLLKILARVTSPTRGRAVVYGSVGSLLEVGTGFNPELTGRENIFLNGSILGMTTQGIAKRFDEIVAFSEIERFIDMPVKRYSSGMYMRLAFSVAAHLDTDILLADEVLAVGDAAFAQKCMAKINNETWKGRTVLFVSHNTAAINNLCSSGLILDQGQMVFHGESRSATQLFLDRLISRTDRGENPVRFDENEDLPAQVTAAGLFDGEGQLCSSVRRGCEIEIRVKMLVRRPSSAYYAAIMLIDRLGTQVMWVTDEDFGPATTAAMARGETEFSVRIPTSILKPGSYQLNIAMCQHPTGKIDRHDGLLPFDVTDHESYRAMKNLYRANAVVAPDLPWISVPDADRKL